jgi:hypothetical protein
MPSRSNHPGSNHPALHQPASAHTAPPQQRGAQAGERGVHDPLHHSRNMSARLAEMIEQLRHDIDRVDEPQMKAMFETAAEVLGGLATAFKHYEEKSEHAWNTQARNS